MIFFQKKQLCICPSLDVRNKVITILTGSKIAFQKKIKRDKSILKANIKENQFGILYYIFVAPNDFDKASELLQINQISME